MRFEDRFWQFTRGQTILHFRSMKKFSETVRRLVVEQHEAGEFFRNDAQKPAAGKYVIAQNLETVAKEMIVPAEYPWVDAAQKLPLLSFVVVNYNYGQFLRTCVESIFNQDYPNLECIIVDNASSDNSNDVIDGLVQDYESAVRLFGTTPDSSS